MPRTHLSGKRAVDRITHHLTFLLLGRHHPLTVEGDNEVNRKLEGDTLIIFDSVMSLLPSNRCIVN